MPVLVDPPINYCASSDEAAHAHSLVYALWHINFKDWENEYEQNNFQQFESSSQNWIVIGNWIFK